LESVAWILHRLRWRVDTAIIVIAAIATAAVSIILVVLFLQSLPLLQQLLRRCSEPRPPACHARKKREHLHAAHTKQVKLDNAATRNAAMHASGARECLTYPALLVCDSTNATGDA